jgi:AcrR family transcriptional regulator
MTDQTGRDERVVDARRRDTRERLVRVAVGLIRRNGVAATGLAEVCGRAGVTKGVFTHHFPGGKEELVAAVVAHTDRDVASGLAALAASGPSVTALVTTLFDGYAALMRAKGTDVGCPVAASVVDVVGSAGPVRTAAGGAFAGWAREISFGLPDHDADVATLVVAALEGAILLARADGDPTTLERTGRTLARLIESGPGRS